MKKSLFSAYGLIIKSDFFLPELTQESESDRSYETLMSASQTRTLSHKGIDAHCERDGFVATAVRDDTGCFTSNREDTVETTPFTGLQHRPPDVVIRTGKLNPTNLKPTDSRLLCSIEKNHAYLYWHEVGTVLVKQGREIIVDPIEKVDEKVLRILLLGAALGLLLHQRGLIVIHGNSVKVNNKGVCFIGNRGFGKSTISAGLHFKGYSTISDDITAISLNNSSQPYLIPGYGRLKLWQDSVKALGLKSQDLSLVHPRYEKQEYLINEPLDTKPIPLNCIYVLDSGEELTIASISPTDALFKIMQNCYCTRFGEEMYKTLSAIEHLQQCSSLINYSNVFSLTRTNNLASLPELIELVEKHISELSN